MKIQDLKEKIGQEAENIISRGMNLERKGNIGNYKCFNKLAHKHDDKHPSLGWDKNRLQFYCFSCGEKMDIYRYYKEIEHKEHDEIMNLIDNEKSAFTSIPHKDIEEKAPIQNESSIKDYTAIVTKLYNEQSKEDKNYFINRGLSLDVVEKYKLCVGDIKKLVPETKLYGRRAIIPIFKDGQVVSFNSRSMDKEPKIKYIKSPGTATFLNIDYLKTAAKGETIVICEGEFNSLSLETIGIKSIAIGGVKFIETLKKLIENTPNAKDIIFLTAFDNDDKGEKATQEMEYKSIEIPKEFNDTNEWLIKDKIGFKDSIIPQVKRPDAVSEYLKKAFITDIEKFKSYKDKKTGFSNLDKVMGGLYSGLYVVGGISSVGKTTFIHQLGDQLAEQGDHIIYFSLEQSKLELVSKSLSRLTAKQDYKNAVSGISIRCGGISQQVIKAAETYENTAQRVNIIEGNFNTTASTIREYVKKYIEDNNVKPVVIIDYLQIIPGDLKMGDKQRIDNTVTELGCTLLTQNI